MSSTHPLDKVRSQQRENIRLDRIEIRLTRIEGLVEGLSEALLHRLESIEKEIERKK